jgi:hypothetical protein
MRETQNNGLTGSCWTVMSLLILNNNFSTVMLTAPLI